MFSILGDTYGNVVDFNRANPEQYIVGITPRLSSIKDTPIVSRRNGP